MQKSFIEVSEESHFPIQNLPYGAYKTEKGEVHLCSAIGDYIIDLFVLDEQGFFNNTSFADQPVFQQSTLNPFMSLGKEAWLEARSVLQALLDQENPKLRDQDELRAQVFKPRSEVDLVMPVQVGDYTDFYSSEQHARNVGSMFRDPENALMPNWKHLPVAYHGRASTVVCSGTPVYRPRGQVLPEDHEKPKYQPSRLVDFELEVGFFTGPGNEWGQPLSLKEAEDRIFGLVLVNDWSARDIQKWEYQPLGPFLAKNWATSTSPWIVPMEALNDFRVDMPRQEPAPLSYLHQKKRVTFDIQLEVYLQTEKMKQAHRICTTNYKNLYWSMAQQLAHHTVTGCSIRPGDLMASGTISGPDPTSYGSMLELSWKGTKPVQLPSGEQRTFLEDGDEVTMTGFAQGKGYRVGFGEVKGKILPPIL